MAVSLNFTTDARAEFDEAVNWYAERSKGAAIGFVTEIDVAIESIIADPTRFVRTYAGCQLCRLKRYPYCVVYQYSADRLQS
ncbi:MAG: type II toxin-antitoxin system RelE/ParE family toxin [Planctomycetota bacterium]|nr:type II toxin-antitoxin system RelE/ParE family toxin [Planctomycetota bacterium]MDA1178108.1 type II toxin-antitoxin system RelE/ParE family toxin [Planctomycetota bacterium]